MPWPSAAQLTALCPLAEGYACEVLGRAAIPELVAELRAWQPAWQAGAASVFSRESYCERLVYLEGEDASERNVCVILLRGEGGLAGMLAAEQIPDALSLYEALSGRMAFECGLTHRPSRRANAAARAPRGAGLSGGQGAASLPHHLGGTHANPEKWFCDLRRGPARGSSPGGSAPVKSRPVSRSGSRGQRRRARQEDASWTGRPTGDRTCVLEISVE